MSFFSKLFRKAETGNEKKAKHTEIKGNFPKFKYFADPIKARSFKRGNASCEICGEKTGYIYANAFYSVEDIENICPWCIANGAAAEKHEGTFHDFEIEDNSIDDENIKELMERTPGFECMQPGIWPCHCSEICVFIEHVGWNDIVRLGLADELEDDLKKIREKYVGCKNEDIGNIFLNESSLSGYLFRCLRCGKYRLTVDLD